MAEPGTERAARPPIRVVAFDAYGTLFDVAAAARQAAAEPDHEILRDRWPQIATSWRVRQLEYTWLRSLADAHEDFWQVTQDALDWALENEGLGTEGGLRQRLLDLYWALSAYPEAKPALQRLRQGGHSIAILSNGSRRMLDAAVSSASLGELIHAVLSVDEVGAFKPHRVVYQMVCDRFRCASRSVAFVSANGWDAAAATGFGFRTIWINREDAPRERLPWVPTTELADLSQVPDAVDTLNRGVPG